MPKDRFVEQTVAEQIRDHDLANALRELVTDESAGARVLELISDMPPLGLVLLLARGHQHRRGEAAAGSSARGGIQELVRAAAERNGIDADHAAEAVVLLQNGTVEKDLAAVAAETARAVSQVPNAVASSVRRIREKPERFLRFAFAVGRDLVELPIEAHGLSEREFERLMNGGVGNPARAFPLFDHTFAALYEVESIVVLRNWLLEVTDRRSVQLALMVYAQTQGVELKREDIEAARTTLKDGDLTPAIVQGVEYFRREHADRFPEILGMLA